MGVLRDLLDSEVPESNETVMLVLLNLLDRVLEVVLVDAPCGGASLPLEHQPLSLHECVELRVLSEVNPLIEQEPLLLVE
jgi:hypothetical protein